VLSNCVNNYLAEPNQSVQEIKMTNKKITQPTAERVNVFWSKVKIQSNNCWEWQAGKDKDGYGNFIISTTAYRVHRIVYFLYYLTDPEEFVVCHNCDNPPCVNPLHLFLGTVLDNVRDRIRKGRSNPPKGENKVSSSKLTNEEVLEIRRRYSKGKESQTALAKAFGVDQPSISRIVSRKRWKHI
jgi:HNH endonuclease/Helix-turn-helix domain